ncbi:MAG: class I SAM-dependent methyltransferase [Eubacteriales bacterium]
MGQTIFRKIGFQVTYEKSVIDELWGEDEKLIYGATPMFMIVAEKPLSSSGYLLDNIQKYWDMRSETYSIQNREELMTEQNKWIDKILPRLPQKKNMRILDIGCGPGFFSIMMAQHGYQVTGIDYSEQMLMHAS